MQRCTIYRRGRQPEMRGMSRVGSVMQAEDEVSEWGAAGDEEQEGHHSNHGSNYSPGYK